MPVTYYTIDGDSKVSEYHYTWMMACRSDGVVFRVNEGHRTFARQTFFWTHQPPLAAFPSNTAPHIKTGLQDHDNDVDQYFGDGITGVFAWLRKHGAHPILNVPGEGWHMHIPDDELTMLYNKFRGPRILKMGMKGSDVQEMQKDLHTLGFYKIKKTDTVFGPYTRAALKQFQRHAGIKADGIFGPTTRKLLNAETKEKKK